MCCAPGQSSPTVLDSNGWRWGGEEAETVGDKGQRWESRGRSCRNWGLVGEEAEMGDEQRLGAGGADDGESKVAGKRNG